MGGIDGMGGIFPSGTGWVAQIGRVKYLLKMDKWGDWKNQRNISTRQ